LGLLRVSMMIVIIIIIITINVKMRIINDYY